MHAFFASALLVACAAGHGGLTFPPPRNNFGNVDPRNTTRQPGSIYRYVIACVIACVGVV